jgi:hypothetical protein
MRPWLIRIVVCLILGAVTTVAVAWGSSAIGEANTPAWTVAHRSEPLDPGLERVWTEHFGSAHFLTGAFEEETLISAVELPTVTVWRARMLASRQFFLQSLPQDGVGATASMFIHAAGWPVASFRGEMIFGPSIQMHDVLEFGDTRVPTGLLWPGFAIDTLFYAAIGFGVFFGFASAKRAIRRARGRCPQCGYDLRGHRHEGTPGEPRRHEGLAAGCPECGWQRTEEGRLNE